MIILLALEWLRTLIGSAFGVVAFLTIVGCASISMIQGDHKSRSDDKEDDHQPFPFNDDNGRHRGIRCICGFTASTGDVHRDSKTMREHLSEHWS